MKYPNSVYNSEINGLVFLNLFLIANKKRLLDVLTSNNINNKSSLSFEWLLNDSKLIEKALGFMGG